MEKRAIPNYTQEQLDLAIDMASQGKTLTEIADALCTTTYSFYVYREHNHSFGEYFRRAQSEGYDVLGDELLTMADQYVDVQKARLKSDNYKWVLGKRKPHVYGDRVDINVTQTMDIKSVLAEARKRVEESATGPRDVSPLPELKDIKKLK